MKSDITQPVLERGSRYDPEVSLNQALGETDVFSDEAPTRPKSVSPPDASSVETPVFDFENDYKEEFAKLPSRRKRAVVALGLLMLSVFGVKNTWGPERGDSLADYQLPLVASHEINVNDLSTGAYEIGVVATRQFIDNEHVEPKIEIGDAKVIEANKEGVQSNPELRVPQVFEDSRAEKALMHFGADARDFLQPRPEVMDAVAHQSHWSEVEEMLPGYVPAQYDHESIFLNAADEFNVPVNALAIFPTIEVHGSENEINHVPAIGYGQHTAWMVENYKLLGLLPEDASKEDFDNAFNGMDSGYSPELYESVFLDPENNIRVTALYLSQLRATVMNDNPDMNQNDPRFWAEVGYIYNGGFKQYWADEKDRAFESRNYANFIEILVFQNAIAAELKQQGLSDNEVEAALSNVSEEFHASMYAMRHLGLNKTHDTDKRLAIINDIIKYEEGSDTASVKSAFERYLRGEALLRDFVNGGTYIGKAQEIHPAGYYSVSQHSGNSLYLKAHLDQ